MDPDTLHWPEYLTEAWLLGLFMLTACVLGVALDHPGSIAVSALPHPFARRALFGLAMGATATAIIDSPAGKRSGAHINPAVTLAFLHLGKVRPRDAALYVTAQITGATGGVIAAWVVLRGGLAHPAVHFVTTRPGPSGALPAFVAEALMSFVLMSVVLAVSASRRAAWTGACAGALVALYITFEAPVSGMSINPARSIGSAIAAGELDGLWIYLLAPPLGMLAAAELMRGRAVRACAKLRHAPDIPCIFCGHGRAPAAATRSAA
jgi:aquaporin Z